MAARTAFIDTETLGAVSAGIAQVVIVGAGYDGRLLRFRAPGVRFIELDHLATQADKRRRVAALGVDLDHVTFAEVDLMTQAVDAVLQGAGHHADQPSLFICEGLVRYLSRTAVNRMLAGLRQRSAVGSRLLLTAAESRGGGGQAARRLYLAAIGEPVRSRFGAGEVARMLGETGWVVDHEIRRPEPGGRERLLVAAIPGP
jgi:methyltransferase (TIGR00027 family)